MMKAIMRDEREMKDSGIEWIGLYPLSWDMYPANGVFSEIRNKNTSLEYTNQFSFRYGEIVDKNVQGELDDKLKDTISAYNIVQPDTIMINGLNLNYDFISQRVAIVREPGIITSAYLALYPDKERINPRFAVYLFKAYDYQQVFHGMGSGIRKTLSFQNFKNIFIVTPQLDMQQTIATYLDDRCSKIDAIIAEAKVSIEEYKELKQAVIYEAVTKGLDKNVEMKDSGIEWIGKIAATMVVKKIKYVTHISRGLFGYRPRNASFLYDGPYPFIQTGDVAKSNHYITEYKQTLSEEGKNISRQFPKGTLTMTIAANVGDVSILGFDAFFPDSVLGFVPFDKYSSEYLYYIFSTMKEEFVLNAISNTQLNLNVERVKELYIPVEEDVENQCKIIEYLDEQTSKIDTMISEKQSLIEDLESYKKSLIYEVVTGKRKVVE